MIASGCMWDGGACLCVYVPLFCEPQAPSGFGLSVWLLSQVRHAHSGGRGHLSPAVVGLARRPLCPLQGQPCPPTASGCPNSAPSPCSSCWPPQAPYPGLLPVSLNMFKITFEGIPVRLSH